MEAPEPGSGGVAVWPRRVAIVGVGLLGGSVALALRRVRPAVQIVGVTRSPETARVATERGVIDRSVEGVEAACSGCDVVVVATPVDRIASLAISAAHAAPRGCLVTDVGSTKRRIVEAVAGDDAADAKFVAAHPIAGGEKGGVGHASATLFDGRLVVITPSRPTVPETGAEAGAGEGSPRGFAADLDSPPADSPPADSPLSGSPPADSPLADSPVAGSPPAGSSVRRAIAFWELTGARTIVMSAAAHDAHLAATSHVPHLVSAAVARLVTSESAPLVGTGWLDTTRIAAGDPELWAAIVRENRAAILDQLRRFRDEVGELVARIESEDDAALAGWLWEAKRVRDGAGR